MSAEPVGQSTTLTIRVEKEVKERLEASARKQDRKTAYLARQAIENYLDLQDWQESRIREAIASADRGEGVPHDRVMQWLASWDTSDELSTPIV